MGDNKGDYSLPQGNRGGKMPKSIITSAGVIMTIFVPFNPRDIFLGVLCGFARDYPFQFFCSRQGANNAEASAPL
jgi:hypothetical protein